jgi:hypothetical protein
MRLLATCTETRFLSLNDFDTWTAWFEAPIYLDKTPEEMKEEELCFDWNDYEEAFKGEKWNYAEEGKIYEIEYELVPDMVNGHKYKRCKLISIKES